MPPNSDNAMARFLFAILKQKNLKDIDWNQVASDPVLLEPISNGHAARMRYSRFRATVSGPPPKRNRTTTDKPRASRSKKEQPPKKERLLIKSESKTSLSSYAQFSPASITSPYLGDTSDDFNTRFLTPCSDDMTQGLSIHPAALGGVRRTSGGAMFPPLDSVQSDFINRAGHGQVSASHSPTFDTFDAAYDLGGYGSGDIHGQGPPASNNTSQSLADGIHVWNERFHDQQQF